VNDETQVEFQKFPKIARLSREAVITEKIDGTNASIYIGKNEEFLTGSRTRWITPETDNFGFSRWAHEHKEELLTLGPGHHFGEWWGSKIQRRYGLQNGERHFSMFNVLRWCLHGNKPEHSAPDNPQEDRVQDVLPSCVGLVPVLWIGCFNSRIVDEVLGELQRNGSHAAPGFMKPEGVVIYHTAGHICFKKTIENDKDGKSRNMETLK